jgi:plastocyanin
VTISGFAFGPASVSVPVGSTVTWTNQDGTAHTVTADDGSFDSGSLAQGATFSQTFDTPGTYPYHCAIHSSMTGTITVVAAPAPSTAPAVTATAETISGFAFGPASVSVPVGSTVTWTNQDGTAHTVTADDGSFDSGSLAQGATFSQTFDTPGTYPYHCAIHSSMTGTITVG